MPSTNTNHGSVGLVTDADLASAAEQWLSAASADPLVVRREWARDGVAVLPCNGPFTAIRIPAAVVYAATGTTDTALLSDVLAGLLGGAVFLDPRSECFYALVESFAATAGRPVPVEQAFAKDLERVPEAAAAARRLVADALQAWSLPQLVEDAELIVSELVSNTVAHAVGDCIRVSMLRLSRRRVRISVVDRDSRRPKRRAPDADGERGRGLLLVEACSSQWGVSVLPGGKSVWSELEAAT